MYGLALTETHLEAKLESGEAISRRESFQLIARTCRFRLSAVFAAGWISHRTTWGKKWRLPWFYEAGVVFLSSGYDRNLNAAPVVATCARSIGCILVARALNGRFWRWFCVLAVEVGTGFAAHYFFEVAGKVAAKAADAKLDVYAEKMQELLECEHKRTAELQTALKDEKVKLTNYSKKAREVVD